MQTVVSLDIAGTLIDFYYFDYVWNEVIPQLYAQKEELEINQAKKWVLHEYDLIGSQDIRWYIPEYWFHRFGLAADPIEVFKTHTDKIRFYPEVSEVLHRLSQKYLLITSSGIPKNLQEVILVPLKHCFQYTFSSITDMTEVTKTIQFYKMISKTVKVGLEHIVHVGDNWESDYITPKKIGITSYLLDRTGEKAGEDILTNLREIEGRLTRVESVSQS